MENIKTVMLDDFINKCMEFDVKEDLDEYMESIMKTSYVSYGEKCNVCKAIINASYYIKNYDGTKKFYVNNPAAFMLYCLKMVELYTYIIVDMSNTVKSYDKLKETGLINAIFAFIPESEIDEFQMLLSMYEDDIMTNEYEPHAYFSGLVERFAKISGVSFDSLSEIIKETLVEIKNE